MLNLTQAEAPPLLGALGWHSRAHVTGAPVSTQPPSARPPARAGVAEIVGLAAALRIPAAVRRLAGVPRGDGHVVIDLPGWKAPEASGAPLRHYLRALGYDARPWGLGVNQGDPERDAALLGPAVLRLADQHGPVSLVGWSLGGVVAREVAREHPRAVRRLVTYGTPIIGGPTYTVGADAYGTHESFRIARLTDELDRTRPITVPVTAVYTRRDGVVAWQACLDHASLSVEHVEVASTHVGLGVDPDVWEVVARRLARPVAVRDDL
jgi:dienelactone hydrolase